MCITIPKNVLLNYAVLRPDAVKTDQAVGLCSAVPINHLRRRLTVSHEAARNKRNNE